MDARNPGRVRQSEVWGAETADGKWSIDRIEVPGTPWVVTDSAAEEGGLYGSLRKARAAIAAGHCDARLRQERSAQIDRWAAGTQPDGVVPDLVQLSEREQQTMTTLSQSSYPIDRRSLQRTAVTKVAWYDARLSLIDQRDDAALRPVARTLKEMRDAWQTHLPPPSE